MVQPLLEMGSLPNPWDSRTLLVHKSTRLWLFAFSLISQPSSTAGWMATKTPCTIKQTVSSSATVSSLEPLTSSLVTPLPLSRTHWSLSGGQWIINRTQWLHRARPMLMRTLVPWSKTAGLSPSKSSSLTGSRSQHTWAGHGSNSLQLLSWSPPWETLFSLLDGCLGLEAISWTLSIMLSTTIVALVLTPLGGLTGRVTTGSTGGLPCDSPFNHSFWPVRTGCPSLAFLSLLGWDIEDILMTKIWNESPKEKRRDQLIKNL